jgi:uncharacterized protein (DUF849 family)
VGAGVGAPGEPTLGAEEHIMRTESEDRARGGRSLRAQGKVMIEVGLNESVRTSQCSRVPTTVPDVIDDVISVLDAGAAVVHYHARDAEEADIWKEVAFYREVMEGLDARGSDAITYPTYLGDLDHIWELAEEVTAGNGLQMAPFDIPQQVGLMIWDEPTTTFLPSSLGSGFGTEKGICPPALEEMNKRDLRPVVAVFDVGQARWVRLAIRAGLLAEPVNLKVFLHARWVIGPTPSVRALDAYLAELEGVEVEVTVVPSTLTDRALWLELLDASIERGLNIRVGLGDCPDIHGDRTNADLVAEAVELIEKHGLSPATAADVTARFGLATRTG